MHFLENAGHYGILAICAIATATLFFVDRKGKTGLFGSKSDVIEETFNGGRRWITRNVVTVALATSCVFSPCIMAEITYISETNAISLAAARTVSLLACILIWRKIAQLGLNSMTAFITFRFNSSFALFLYYINSILSFVYILYVYNGPLLYNFLEHYKLGKEGLLLFTGFLLLCSIGGMRIALPLCSILTLMEICGSSFLLVKVQNFNETDIGGDYRFCNSYNPLHLLATTFPLLLTAQPIYRLYYHIGSQKKALTAMGIGYCIFLLKFLLAFFIVRPIQAHGKAIGVPVYRAFHITFLDKMNNKLDAQREGILHSARPSDYVLRASVLGYQGSFALNCLVYGPMAAFYCLRICQLLSEMCEQLISHLQDKSTLLTGEEIHQIHRSLYISMVCLTLASLLSADKNILMPKYRQLSLYVPHITNFFMVGVTTMIASGAAAPPVRLIHVISAWILPILLALVPVFTILWNGFSGTFNEALVEWEQPASGIWACIGVWMNFCCLLFNSLVVMVLVSLSTRKKPISPEETPAKLNTEIHLYKTTRNYKLPRITKGRSQKK